jgi:hypothetical protein
MITITSERGLEHIDSWEDVATRPGFVQDVDPAAVALDAIIGNYQEAEPVRCGLSTCRQPHGRGYLVTLRDGRLTNIGKDCGRNYFGVDFETMRGTFDRDLLRQERREIIVAAQHRAEALVAEIAELRGGQYGADWLHKQTRALLTNGVLPSYVVTAIDRMIRDRDGSISIEREATQEEIELIEAAERRRVEKPHYIGEDVGLIDALFVLYPENNLRELVLRLGHVLDEVRAANVDDMTGPAMGHLVKAVAEIDENMDRLRSTVKAGVRLLNPRNIGQLVHLARSEEDQRGITRFAKSLGRAERPN